MTDRPNTAPEGRGRGLQLRTRILLCVAALSLVTTVVGGANLALFLRGRATVEQAESRVLGQIVHLGRAHLLVVQVEQALLQALLSPVAGRGGAGAELDRISLEFYAALEDREAALGGRADPDPVVEAYRAYSFLARKVLAAEGTAPIRDHPDLWEAFAERKLRLIRQLEHSLERRTAATQRAIAGVRADFRASSVLSLVLAVTALAVTLLIAGVLNRFFIRPVGELSRAVQAVAGGRLDLPVVVGRGDELGLLATTLEDLRVRLAEREGQLVAHRGDLERAVVDRTDELTATNVQLSREVEERARVEEQLRTLNETLEQRVTERTRELRRSQTLDAMGRLAGGVAHDFNNLLGGVLGCLYTARLQGEIPPVALEELERAQQLCKRGGQLTAQLLAVARQGSGQAEAVDGLRLLRDLGSLLERTLPLHIRFHLEVEGVLPVLWADRSRLHTALLNLVLNARDAMPEGGTITLRSWAPPGRWLIQVQDTGPGVPDVLREKVFEPFFTTKEVGEGTGLGLSLVHATAEELGGTVRLDSAPGSGARFTLSLPVAEGVSRLVQPQSLEVVHPLGAGPLLVVEDEPPVARMMVAALEDGGYSVLMADTGTAALEQLTAHRDEVALVLLDLVLPGVSAESIYRLLRSVAPELPVLFTTGREDLARRLDPDVLVLPKPFTDTELLAAVAAVLAPDEIGDGGPIGLADKAW